MLGFLRWRGMASVHVYRLADRIVLSRQERTARGVALPVEPTVRLPRSAAPEKLGAALLTCLAGPAKSRPEPRNWDRAHDRLVEAAGVSSLRWLRQSAVLVRAERNGRRITLVPTLNLGTRGAERGFRALRGHERTVAVGAPPAQVGESLLEALGQSTREFGDTGRV